MSRAGATARTWIRSPRAVSGRAWSPGRRAGHLRPADLTARLRGLRDRPAGNPGPETAAAHRIGPSAPGIRSGRFRSRGILAGTTGGGVRSGASLGRHRDWGRHLPHRGRDRGHAARDREPRPGFPAGVEVPAAHRTRRAIRTGAHRAGGEIRARLRDPVPQFLPPDRNARPGPRGRIRHGAPRALGRADRALLREPDGRPAPDERRGVPTGENLVMLPGEERH